MNKLCSAVTEGAVGPSERPIPIVCDRFMETPRPDTPIVWLHRGKTSRGGHGTGGRLRRWMNRFFSSAGGFLTTLRRLTPWESGARLVNCRTLGARETFKLISRWGIRE